MPNLRDIRKRISSVREMEKITKAMKLVAAVRLRKAQERLLALRPYVSKVLEIAAITAARVEADRHPLLVRREPRRYIVIAITSDKGLCGAFNANVLRSVEDFTKRIGSETEVRLVVAGLRGIAYYRARGRKTEREIPNFMEGMTFEKASALGKWITDEYVGGMVDSVVVIYNEFKSAGLQRVVTEEILPIKKATLEAAWKDVEFIFEPEESAILDKLLSMYVATEIFRAAIESTASEYGARMTAMENATKNAGEMIRSLTLEYNKARQSAITKELMEIVGGTEAQRASS